MTSAADRLLDPIRAVSESVVNPELLADDVTVDRLILNGRRYKEVVGEALLDATIEQDIEGASTLTVALRDTNREILRSGIFTPMNGQVLASIDEFEFALVQASKSQDELSLVFEDKQVNDLRQVKTPKKADRAKVTRAQFAFGIVREIRPRIPFYAPDQDVVQPIAGSKDRPSSKDKQQSRAFGFAPRANVNVKGKRATREQLSNIERVLDVGVSMRCHDKILLASIATITQESTAINLTGGDRDSVGLFQQRASQGWPASRNVERDSKAFFNAAKQKFHAHPSIGIGELCQAVQISAFPQAYKQWVPEARHTLGLYRGGNGGSHAADTVKRKAKYLFTRGLPAGAKGESSWDCLKRLADEVQWRCFAVAGAIYFLSESRLYASKPRMSISEDDPAVLAFDFDIDAGKSVHEATLTVRAERWVASPGTVIAIEDAGPATGRWLVATTSRSLFSNITEITLRKPNLGKSVGLEPEADDASGGNASSVGGSGDAAGVPKSVQKAYAKAKAIHAKRYPYAKGGGHNDRFSGPYDCSGAVSAVLHAAGHLPKPESTGALSSFGESGKGRYLTVYVKDLPGEPFQSHSFIEFHMPGKGVEHFGTGRWGKTWGGAGFNPQLHPHTGFKQRHFKKG